MSSPAMDLHGAQASAYEAQLSRIALSDPQNLARPVSFEASHERAVRLGRPVIFGEASAPLSGRLHEARGAVIGAVVLFNPWGYEENGSFTSFQLLAHRLAECGFETLRFDYTSCGNSWGEASDPQRLLSWVSDCGQAINFLSARTGRGVHVVGLRMGATLAVLASARYPIEAAVLWDPVVNGRRYLRALRAMSMMGVSAGPDPAAPGSLVTIGHTLSASTVEELNRLDLQTLARARIGSALLISRPAANDPKRLLGTLQTLGVESSLEEHAGTERLLDCAAEQSIVPTAILDRIVGWLRSRPTGAALHCPALPEQATLLAPLANGWTEEHLSIGPVGLAAVLTLPQQQRRAGVVLMINNGVARSIGPARAWVEWARLWASLGIASLRLDLSGLGDSGRHPQQRPANQYPIEVIDDLAVVIQELRRRGLTPAVVVGLCSGAFLSLDAAAARVGLSAVVAINAQLFHLPDPPGSPDRSRRAAPPTHPWVQRFFEHTRAGRYLARNLPYPFWWLLDLLRLQPAPLRGATAAAAQARVLLIYGQDNLGLLRARQRARSAVHHWHCDGSLLVIEGLDHSMFAPQIRSTVEARVRSFLLEQLPNIPAD
jgi:pimeloyl-ACP methyl ester carboxylesterase